jgi:hypothetical protein
MHCMARVPGRCRCNKGTWYTLLFENCPCIVLNDALKIVGIEKSHILIHRDHNSASFYTRSLLSGSELKIYILKSQTLFAYKLKFKLW